MVCVDVPMCSVGTVVQMAWEGQIFKVEVQQRRGEQKGCREGKDEEQKVRT